MEHSIPRRRRTLVALLVSALLIGVPMTSALAHPKSKIRSGFCHVDWRSGPHSVKHLIRCAQRRWHVPGGARKAISVGRCESGFNPKASSGSSDGVFQQNSRYWPGRAKKWGFEGWSAFNGRANVLVSIQMAHSEGWSAWACA